MSASSRIPTGKALQCKPASVKDVTFSHCVLWKICFRLAPSGVGMQLFCVSSGTFLTVSFGAVLQNEPKSRKGGQPGISLKNYIPHLQQNVNVDECTLKFTLMNKWMVLSVADLI